MHPDQPFRRQLSIGLVEEAPGTTVRLTSFIDDFYVDLTGSGRLHEWAVVSLPEGVGLL
jgi:hypothetical protein